MPEIGHSQNVALGVACMSNVVMFGACMLRVILFAVASLTIATPAWACTLVMPEPRPGETVEQARFRLAGEEQARLWRRSEVVYLAEISQQRLVSGGLIETTFRPIASIKGPQPGEALVEQGFSGSGCAQFMIGDLAVVYASAEAGGDAPRLRAEATLFPREIQDERVVAPLADRDGFEDLGFRFQ